ncbi:hypothetical protein ABW20_dc0107700 [Dactylellina cionopaga]|nr:hypothetical protein ABW20_dc0107700 [Dactylellina cionopaga]
MLVEYSSLLLAILLFCGPVIGANNCHPDVPQNAGTCIIRVWWSRFRSTTRDWKYNEATTVHEDLYVNIIDGKGSRIDHDLNPPAYVRCNGEGGGECNFASDLRYRFRLSPQIQRDYLQFYYGWPGMNESAQAWHTDPEPTAGRSFVDIAQKDIFPYCEDTGWVQREKDENGLYLWPFNESRILDAIAKEVKCLFNCDYPTIKPDPDCLQLG